MQNRLFLLALIIGVFSSCKKDDASDSQQPTFESVVINDEEMLTVSENIVSNGDVLTFQIKVNDNIALSELSVEIHEAGDGHAHERTIKTSPIPLEPLVFGPQVYDLEGQQTKTIEITVSDALNNEATDYHLNLILIDKASNRTTTVQTFEIK